MDITRQKIPVVLGAVQETLLIPLLGRAVETEKGRGLINDPKAVEIVETLDYDFDKWRGTQSMTGATLRTRMYDEEIARFLEENPAGTVVEIGCGLNTRFERLDNGRAQWFELDLPDSMQLRRQFFEDTERRKMIEGSVTDSDWHDRIEATGGPYLFVSEAVIIYLESEQVERALRSIAARFPGARLLMDTTSTQMVQGQAKHDVMRTLPKDSWFRWECNDPQTLEHWGLRLLHSKTFLDASPELVNLFPLAYRL
ncbi:MAG: class I SAM-dependent methyltransferase, partial [Myxococcota bacterium]